MSDQELNNKRIVPFMASIYDWLEDYAYTILRVGGGLIFGSSTSQVDLRSFAIGAAMR